ncbi:MAG TPA: DUF1232 domain-containing protein [Thermomicrobiaceae bacterium]|nr:DUF1232 domain-containing protein [Thermomicrobiaceae bacterium]
MGRLDDWRRQARRLKREAHAIYLAARDPRTPWYARLLALGVVGYLFSPLDLIPDFVPVLGLVDDLLLVPLGIKLVLKLIPSVVLAEHREAIDAGTVRTGPGTWVAATVIVAVWIAALVLVVRLVVGALGR